MYHKLGKMYHKKHSKITQKMTKIEYILDKAKKIHLLTKISHNSNQINI